MIYYPRSLLRLVMLGWVLMALPLFAAIVFAWISFADLSKRSDIGMQQAAEATRLAWELDEDLVRMQRILGQYQVLRDGTLLHDYVTARDEWLHNCDAFARVPLLASLAGRVREMVELETAAYQRFVADGRSVDELQALLENHSHRTIGLIESSNGLAVAERESFRVATEAFQQHLLIAVVLAIALAGTMFWFARRVLARLLVSVERAVIALGNNLLDRRIQLQGPDDLRWIGKRLDWLRRRLRRLERDRTRALRHISHELKTPLAALREGASLLGEGVAGPLSPKQEKIAGIMQGNALRLQELIDGLLKLQQAEHLQGRIDPVAIRLDELIQASLATHKLAARDKRLRIAGTLTPLEVLGGQEAVVTIVNNLLSNAIKFSPERGTVRLSLVRDNRMAVLDVIDEGPGVPEADRKNIFEPFYRGPGTKSVAGVGLGLAIAREYATAQNGSLDVLASAAGAHFRATLPLVRDAA